MWESRGDHFQRVKVCAQIRLQLQILRTATPLDQPSALAPLVLYPSVLIPTSALRLYPLYLTATINHVHAASKQVLLDLLVHHCRALWPETPILHLLRAPSRPRLRSDTPFNLLDVCLGSPLHMRTVLFWDHSWDLISLETLHFSDHLLEILVGNLLLLFLKATIDLGDPSQGDA